MRNLFFVILVLIGITSCGGEKCNECTGTNANGEIADFTVCDNDDGTTTRTNNTTNESTTDTQDYVASVAFFESLGLDCK